MLDITVEVVKMKDSELAGGSNDGSLLISRTMDKTDSKGASACSEVPQQPFMWCRKGDLKCDQGFGHQILSRFC